MTTNTIVGYYTTAENFTNVLKSITSSVIQALFPNFSKKIHENEIEGIKSIKKIVPILLMGNLIMFIFVFFLSSFLTKIVGEKFSESINILKILSVVPIFIAISSSFSILGLLNLRKSAIVAKIALIGGFVGIISSILLTFFFKHYGTAIASVIAEVIIAGLGFYYFSKYEKKIEKRLEKN